MVILLCWWIVLCWIRNWCRLLWEIRLSFGSPTFFLLSTLEGGKRSISHYCHMEKSWRVVYQAIFLLFLSSNDSLEGFSSNRSFFLQAKGPRSNSWADHLRSSLCKVALFIQLLIGTLIQHARGDDRPITLGTGRMGVNIVGRRVEAYVFFHPIFLWSSCHFDMQWLHSVLENGPRAQCNFNLLRAMASFIHSTLIWGRIR